MMKLQDFFTEYVVYSPLTRQELEEQLEQANAEIEELRQQNQQLKRTLQLWRDYHQRQIVHQAAIDRRALQRTIARLEAQL